MGFYNINVVVTIHANSDDAARLEEGHMRRLLASEYPDGTVRVTTYTEKPLRKAA